jgi:hypothetical protein
VAFPNPEHNNCVGQDTEEKKTRGRKERENGGGEKGKNKTTFRNVERWRR